MVLLVPACTLARRPKRVDTGIGLPAHAADIPKRATPAPKEPPPDVGEGPVSLSALLAHADTHAPAIVAARARVARGDAAIEGAEPLLPQNPRLRLWAGPRFRPDGTGVDARARLEQPVEIAGERGARLVAATRLRERYEAELDAVRWKNHWEIHATYHQALVARERLKTAKRINGFQSRLLEVAKKRKKAGDISGLQVRLAEGDAARARVREVGAEQAYRALRLRLARLSGWPVEQPPEPRGELDPPRKAPGLERIVELAEAHQPRLRVLEKAIAAADAQSEAADRDGWPEPVVGVQVNREGGGPGSAGAYIVLGTLGVEIPIFERNQRERAEAEAEAEIARADAETFRQRLEAELALAASEVDAAAARLEVYGEEIIPTFADNLDMLERAYELGEIDILEVSVARERFLNIQSDALEAYDDYFRAVAELEALVGTDLWPETLHGGDRR